jgi:predicted DNA-binding ribbon-helix-helix protein
MSLQKKSFTLLGHRTSVALEAEFWSVLEREAARQGSSLSAFVAEIDAGRGERPLASALRLRALASRREPS